MEIPGDAARLRIYIGVNDAHGDQPLVETLVNKAREMGLAGATATRCIIGYGAPSRFRPAQLLISQDRPITIEIVDTQEKIDAYLDQVGPTIQAGLITIETIRVLRYGPIQKR